MVNRRIGEKEKRREENQRPYDGRGLRGVLHSQGASADRELVPVEEPVDDIAPSLVHVEHGVLRRHFVEGDEREDRLLRRLRHLLKIDLSALQVFVLVLHLLVESFAQLRYVLLHVGLVFLQQLVAFKAVFL